MLGEKLRSMISLDVGIIIKKYTNLSVNFYHTYSCMSGSVTLTLNDKTANKMTDVSLHETNISSIDDQYMK